MSGSTEGLLEYTFPASASQGGFAGRRFLGKIARQEKGDTHVLFRLVYIRELNGTWKKMRSTAEVRAALSMLSTIDLSDEILED